MNNTISKNDTLQLLARIRDLVESSQKFLVASHIDPDGDALGTQLAFAQYLESEGKDVFLVRDGAVPDKYAYLPGVDRIPLSTDEYIDSLEFDAVVILECPELKRIGKAAQVLKPDARIINIDHHLDNALFGSVNWINTLSSSVGEMVYEYFQEIGFSITSETAELLYTAIMTDTGRFRFKSTSPRTMQIAGELIAAGARPQEISDHVYFSMRPESMKLLGKVLNTISYDLSGRLCVLHMDRVMLDETGADVSDAEGIVDFTLYSRNVEAGIFLREQSDGTTKASLRSRDGINVAAIAKLYGGGGHFNAAGCTMKTTLDRARKELIERFGDLFGAA